MASFFERLKAGAQVAADKTKQEIEEVQLRARIVREHGEIGRRAVELVDAGEITHPELVKAVEAVHGLEQQLQTLQSSEPI